MFAMEDLLNHGPRSGAGGPRAPLAQRCARVGADRLQALRCGPLVVRGRRRVRPSSSRWRRWVACPGSG